MTDTLMSQSFQSLQSFHPLAFSMPQGAEWIVIAALGLLLFGKRLPEVGKGMGQAIMQFKKGLKGVEDDVEAASNASDAPRQIAEPTVAAVPQKFDPYTGKPMETVAEEKPATKFDPYTGKPIEEPAAS